MRRREFLRTTAVSMAALLARPLQAASKWHQAASIPINTQEIYPTVHQQRLYVAGGIAAKLGVPYFTSDCYGYDPRTDAWSTLPSLPEDLHHAALVSDGKKIFAMGGFNGGYSHVWRMRANTYSLEVNEDGEAIGEWQSGPTLPTLQAEGVASYHNGAIHIVTGQQPKGAANSARTDHTEGDLHWRLEHGQWGNAAPIPTPRNSATGGWLDKQLIVTGGRTSNGNLAVTEIYDANEDRWRDAQPMPLPQAGTASVVHNGSLVVFGGEIFSPSSKVFSEVWRYELAADQWTPLPDMSTPRHGLGAGIFDNRAYVIGGATEPGGSGTSNANEILELDW